ncbi:dTDP-4-dehydrorhamnose reductase [Bacteroides helcogenes P 36-108]|uniref:dTDP-4-dehydrorhamnose reductase n=2 Tax=Bacteroides helcogenes TaxID=290053 RepID=E6SUV3_BACT6|nr:dTDP-4-dehydrorhamnose reductase [Bacteroides helcogenes P 36-108]
MLRIEETNRQKNMKKKVLIIGANGFTGRRILNDLSHNAAYEVTGCSLHDDICPNSGDYHFVRIDIRDCKALNKLFEEVQPYAVINTSALSVPDYCEIHHEEAEAINITAVMHLAQHCRTHNSRLIHLSTDFVFDGNTKRLYTEEDTPAPVNYYGKTKLEGERQIATICNDYAIARVVVVYGNALPGQHGNIFQLVANRLRNNEEIFVVSDQWRTPTFVGDVSQGVEKLINHPHNGIYHICGGDCLTIAGIAYRVADILGLDRSLICPISTEEMKEKTPRPCFSGLSIEKARKELKYQPHTLDEGIRLMFRD